VEEVGAGVIRQCCATVKRYSGLREVANGAGDGAISPPVYARGCGRLDKLGDRFHPRAVGTAWSLGQASCGCLLSDLFSLSVLASEYAVAELVEARATIGRSFRQASCGSRRLSHHSVVTGPVRSLSLSKCRASREVRQYAVLPANQGQLLRAAPALYLLFAGKRFVHPVKLLREHDAHRQTASRVPRPDALVVLPQASVDVKSAPRIEGPVSAFEDVHVWHQRKPGCAMRRHFDRLSDRPRVSARRQRQRCNIAAVWRSLLRADNLSKPFAPVCRSFRQASCGSRQAQRPISHERPFDRLRDRVRRGRGGVIAWPGFVRLPPQ